MEHYRYYEVRDSCRWICPRTRSRRRRWRQIGRKGSSGYEPQPTESVPQASRAPGWDNGLRLFAYETGLYGYVEFRQIGALGHACLVAEPDWCLGSRETGSRGTGEARGGWSAAGPAKTAADGGRDRRAAEGRVTPSTAAASPQRSLIRTLQGLGGMGLAR